MNPIKKILPPPPAALTAPVSGQLPPPPPPAPVSPESFDKNEYNLLSIRLSNTKAIEVEGKATTITELKTFIEKNFKSWTEDNQDKPRGVLFHLPEGVSKNQAQKAFKEIQDFKSNTFVVQKEDKS